jgi:hypothetical protein
MKHTRILMLVLCVAVASCSKEKDGNGGPEIPCDKGSWDSNATIQEEQTLNETYAGYTHIGGSVHISGETFTDVDSLTCLEYVGRILNITSNPVLTDLSGLCHVTETGGTLNIEANDSLVHIDGLNGITAIGTGTHDGTKYLQVYNNPVLENIDGLINVTSIAEGLFIYDNPELTSIAGLDNLTTLGGDQLLVTSNPRLPQCEVDALIDRVRAGGFTGEAITAGNDTTATCD